jgi:transcriptional regulator with XRE-family HTH domain
MNEKENNPYRYCRKYRGFSQDDVNDMTGISKDHLGDIERNDRDAAPEEVASLAECYHIPRLCNFYCSQECPVGKQIGLPDIDITLEDDGGLAQVVMNVLSCIDDLNDKVDSKRLHKIAQDGKITEDEYEDFYIMKDILRSISETYYKLDLWEKESKAEEQWENEHKE